MAAGFDERTPQRGIWNDRANGPRQVKMRIWEEGRPPAPLDAVGVLPWLDLSQPIILGDTFVFPTAEGLMHLGDQGPDLARWLRAYRVSWEGEREVRPSIVVHRDQLASAALMPRQAVRRAIDVLIAATAYLDSTYSFTNATTFQLYTHTFGSDNTQALTVRRRNGTLYIGSPNIAVPRPAHAGICIWHSSALRDALLAAADDPNCYHLFEALAWYRRASSDSDYTDRDIDRVLLGSAHETE